MDEKDELTQKEKELLKQKEEKEDRPSQLFPFIEQVLKHIPVELRPAATDKLADLAIAVATYERTKFTQLVRAGSMMRAGAECHSYDICKQSPANVNKGINNNLDVGKEWWDWAYKALVEEGVIIP